MQHRSDNPPCPTKARRIPLALTAILVAMPALQGIPAERLPSAATQTNTASILCSGAVINIDGHALPGATLDLYQDPAAAGSGRTANLELKEQTTSDSAGKFAFRIHRANTLLLARKPGLAPSWKAWNPTRDTEIKLVLTPPDTIAGLVVDDRDSIVTNALVSIAAAYSELLLESGTRTINYISGKPARTGFTARTGADGRFHIDVPTNTTADLAALAPGKVLREPERMPTGPYKMQCRSGQRDLKLVLEPGASVEGKVVDQENGQPIPNARVSLAPAQPKRGDSGRDPVISAADGSFRLTEVAAGSYFLHAASGTNSTAQWIAERIPLTVSPGEGLRDVRVPAGRGGWLEVAVLTADDRRPVPQATITALQTAFQTSALTDPNGIALLRLSPGEYRIVATRDGVRAERPVATAEPGVTNRIEIEFNPPPRITGIVRDSAGTPVAGQRLVIFPESRAGLRDIKTDDNGRFELMWAPLQPKGLDGPFSLIARDPARNLVAIKDIEEGALQLDLRLESGLILAGRVVDPEGQPIPNAVVRVLLLTGSSAFPLDSRTVRTGEDGRFQVSACPPDRQYSLLASARGFGSATLNFRKDTNNNTGRVELDSLLLKRADRHIAGLVLDPDDHPVTNALVLLTGHNQPGGTTRTDDQGRFTFDKVCDGAVELLANLRGATGTAQAMAGETNVTVKLDSSVRPLSRDNPAQRPSLLGQPLPDLAPLGLGSDPLPAGKRLLLCLLDIEQRPSRRLLKLLTDQHDTLQTRGVSILGLQVAPISAEALKQWSSTNPLPFPIVRLAEANDKTRWASSVESLPWLILTDPRRNVVAEGLSIEELDAKLASPSPP